MKKTDFYCHECKKFFEEMWEPGAKVQCPQCKKTFDTIEDDGQALLVSNSNATFNVEVQHIV